MKSPQNDRDWAVLRAKRSQQAWVSLPIIVFLILVASLSLSYNKRLLSSQQWRGQLQEVSQQKQVWRRFEKRIIRHVSFAFARKSQCVGFCPLSSESISTSSFEWRDGSEYLSYQFDYYVNPQKGRFYRLCARHDPHHYRCWWWKKERLISHGLVIVNNMMKKAVSGKST